MKIVLDTSVLYPTVLREILLAVAKTGAYNPIWSPRILEELKRAATRSSDQLPYTIQSEIAIMNMQFPNAQHPDGSDDLRFELPDPNDIHVLSLARAQGADMIVTLNLKDFPRDVMIYTGVRAQHPDVMLTECANCGSRDVAQAVAGVLRSIPDMAPRKIMRKAGLGRLAKALAL